MFRARAKSGVKILGATATTDQWNVSFESENTKQTVGRVTIFRNEQESESTSSPTSLDENEYVEYFVVIDTSIKYCNSLKFFDLINFFCGFDLF